MANCIEWETCALTNIKLMHMAMLVRLKGDIACININIQKNHHTVNNSTSQL